MRIKFQINTAVQRRSLEGRSRQDWVPKTINRPLYLLYPSLKKTYMYRSVLVSSFIMVLIIQPQLAIKRKCLHYFQLFIMFIQFVQPSSFIHKAKIHFLNTVKSLKTHRQYNYADLTNVRTTSYFIVGFTQNKMCKTI